MVQDIIWKADCHSARQKISRFHYIIIIIIIIIISVYFQAFWVVFFPFRFLDANFVCSFNIFHASYMSRPSHPSWLITLTIYAYFHNINQA
jgi:hypothetical protein